MARNQVIDKDLGWKELLARVAELAGDAYTKVGLLGGDDAGGLHEPGSPLTTTEIGIVNEFGTADGRVPERSFLRACFDLKREELAAMAAKLLTGVIDGKLSVDKALNVLGAWFAAEVKKFITEGPEVPPPNAESTRRRKEKAGAWNADGMAQQPPAAMGPRTLVESMTMVRSITWAVFTSRAARVIRGGS